MNPEDVKKLEKLISDMDLPFYRKSIASKSGIRWLNRNIEIRNSEHKNLEEAKKLIHTLL